MLSQERAEDAVQQAFVNAYASLCEGEPVRSLKPWLYRIAHNAALNLLRDRTLQHEQLDERLNGVERPDQELQRRDELRELLAAVGELPERQRDAIVLRELEGRSYEDIAAGLGVTNGAVRALLNRARSRLRAGASALTPIGLLVRLAPPVGGDASIALRLGELGGAGGVGALATKLCASVLVTGAVAGGVGGAPLSRHEPDHPPAGRAETKAQTVATTASAAPTASARLSQPTRIPPARSVAVPRQRAAQDRDQRRPRADGGRHHTRELSFLRGSYARLLPYRPWNPS